MDNPNQDLDIEQIIAFAAGLASDPTNELEVALHALDIKRAMRPRTLARRLLDAVPIVGTVEQINYEERSCRYVVHYTPEHPQEGQDPIEYVRTDRIDNVHSYAQDFIVGLQPGDRVVIYKTTESTGNPRKPKVRVAPFIRKIE